MAVKGINLALYAEDATPGTFKLIGGQRGATLSETVDTFEVTSKSSGTHKEYETAFADWKISADGVFISDDAGYLLLVAAMRAKTKIKVRWTEGGASKFEGMAFITSRDLDGPYDGEATYSMELQGTGAPTSLNGTPVAP